MSAYKRWWRQQFIYKKKILKNKKMVDKKKNKFDDDM